MSRLTLPIALAMLASACTSAPPRGTAGGATEAVVTPPSIVAASHTATAAAFVSGATAMLGRPYRYGGADPDGFDCSGLVNYAAAQVGMRLPRTARELMKTGAEVRRAALAPGDLVFMHLTAKELHVGIAVDATRFVHAPAAGGRVRVDSLDAPPYGSGFLTARRPDFPP